MLCTTKKEYTLALVRDLKQGRRCIISYDYGGVFGQNKNLTVFILFKDKNLIFYDGKFWFLRQKYHEFIERLV